MSKNTRKIKILSNPLKKNELIVHPLTLNLISHDQTNKNIVASELNYIDGKPQFDIKVNNKTNYSREEIQKFMALPYLNLNSESFLFIYNISSFDELLDYVARKSSQNSPIRNILRIIDMYVKNNYEDLVNYNKALYKLFEIINNKYWNKDFNSEKIIDFINKWIKNKNINDFHFNFSKDVYKFINS